MKRLKNKLMLVISIQMLLPALLLMHCASTEMERFRANVHRLPDDALLTYYHGLNDRLKDIDNGLKSDMLFHDDVKPDVISQQTFIVGGAGFGLVQKRKIVLKELNRRNLAPKAANAP